VTTVVDLIEAAGASLVLTSGDERAIRDCTADPALIAEAFVAAARHEWGGDFMQQNLSAKLVVLRLSGYLAWKESQSATGHSANRRRTDRPGAALVLVED